MRASCRTVLLATMIGVLSEWPCLAAGSGPFGTGLPDTGSFPGSSLFPQLFAKLLMLQGFFNEALTTAVLSLHHDGRAFWSLLGVSFAYGVVHAVGPGHGKAVLSSYIIANRQTLRNGILLAFLAALAQAIAAVLLIVIAALVLHATSVSITHAAYDFELGSDGMIMALGLWLCWTRVVRPWHRAGLAQRASAPSAVLGSGSLQVALPFSRRFQANDGAYAAEDCDCGDLHLPDAAVARGPLDLRKAWSVIAATALRPCTGALIVLVFALSQHVLWAGIAAAIVMSLGTGSAVCMLAIATVSTRATVSLAFAGAGRGPRAIMGILEGLAAVCVLMFGGLLLVAHLNA